MNRRSFLRSTVAGAAAIPFGALVQAQDKPGVGRGHTQGYGPLFETPDQTGAQGATGALGALGAVRTVCRVNQVLRVRHDEE